MNMKKYKGSIDAFVALALNARDAKRKTLYDILLDVCRSFDLDINKVATSKRDGELVMCRKIYCFISRMKTGYTYKQIGEEIGSRDHTTVIHNINSVKHFIQTNDTGFYEKWQTYLTNSRLFTHNDFRGLKFGMNERHKYETT
jgi:chromosomal replication initiation ATPase DnaA